jgi:hypothetical protein
VGGSTFSASVTASSTRTYERLIQADRGPTYACSMPSSRRSRRGAAIATRQRRQPRISTREFDPADRRTPAAPLPTALAAAADRAAVEAERAETRRVLLQIEERKRAARRDGDERRLMQLSDLSRRFEAAMRRTGSLDRYPR